MLNAKSKKYKELNYEVDGADLEYFRSFNWSRIIRSYDIESFDLKMLKVIIPSLINHGAWLVIVDGYLNIMRNDLQERSDHIMHFSGIREDRREKINMIYDLFLSKHQPEFKVSGRWHSSKREISVVHQNYNNFCDDTDFDSEDLCYYGLSHHLKEYCMKTPEDFIEKFTSIKRGTGYMKKRHDVVLGFVLRGLDPHYITEYAATKLGSGAKADIALNLVVIRAKINELINSKENHNLLDTKEKLKRAESIVKSCSRVMYSVADGMKSYVAQRWSQYLMKEDIPFLAPIVSKNKSECLSLIREMQRLMAK